MSNNQKILNALLPHHEKETYYPQVNGLVQAIATLEKNISVDQQQK